MAFIKWLHDWQVATPFALVIPTPLAIACFVLFLWSFGPAIKLRVGRPMVLWLRLTWALTLLPAVTGIILAVGGGKTASAVAAAGQTTTRYGYPPDPSRNLEHWMYAAFILLSLYIIEVLVQGKLVKHNPGLRYLPLVTFFMWGCAFMVYRVAVLPGSTPGT
jgi:hypothetical protein